MAATRAGRPRAMTAGASPLSVMFVLGDSTGADDAPKPCYACNRGKGTRVWQYPELLEKPGRPVKPGKLCHSCYVWLRRHFNVNNSSRQPHKHGPGRTPTKCRERLEMFVEPAAEAGEAAPPKAEAAVDEEARTAVAALCMLARPRSLSTSDAYAVHAAHLAHGFGGRRERAMSFGCGFGAGAGSGAGDHSSDDHSSVDSAMDLDDE